MTTSLTPAYLTELARIGQQPRTTAVAVIAPYNPTDMCSYCGCDQRAVTKIAAHYGHSVQRSLHACRRHHAGALRNVADYLNLDPDVIARMDKEAPIISIVVTYNSDAADADSIDDVVVGRAIIRAYH